MTLGAESRPLVATGGLPGGGGQFLGFVRRKPLGAFGLALIVLLILTALGADLIAPYDPLAIDSDAIMTAPSARHVMGTDRFGRDLLSRIVYGSRISLAVGVASIVVGTSIGTLLGLLSAHFEGTLDLVVQRFIDAKQAFPSVILATAILAAFGPGTQNVILAISIASLGSVARVVRSAALKEKQNLYIEAARAIGCGESRIMFGYLFPNILAPIIILATVGLGSAITLEASLSFLGLGPSEPTPSWGLMLTGGARQYITRAPWLFLFPGLAISLAVLGWNLLGDALRDIWDPRLRGSERRDA
jgi:peptide/nickel transport system permease protein